jgi:hypothetical protein
MSAIIAAQHKLAASPGFCAAPAKYASMLLKQLGVFETMLKSLDGHF